MDNRAKEQLMKLLRLLESNRSGERAAAAKKATELMRKHKLDWDKLIGGGTQNARGSSFVDFNSGSQDFLNGFKRGKDTGYAEGYNAGYVQGVAAAQAEAATRRGRRNTEDWVADDEQVNSQRADDIIARIEKINRMVIAMKAAEYSYKRLNERETSFLTDMFRMAQRGWTLTPRQLGWLNRIYERILNSYEGSGAAE